MREMRGSFVVRAGDSKYESVLIGMFNQYSFIPDQHKVALQGVIRHGVTAHTLVQLYEATLTVLNASDPTKLALTDKLAFSRLVTETHEIAVVTSRETGVYLQLAREKGKTTTFITVGQKWAMEQPSPHSTVNTIFW